MSGRASGSCRCSTRCWARYQPLERRPWSSPTGCPPAKWCLNWLQSQLFRQILSPFFMPKNDGIPWLSQFPDVFPMFPAFNPNQGPKKQQRVSQVFRSLQEHGLEVCALHGKVHPDKRKEAYEAFQGTGAPRSRGVGSIEGSDSTSPSWGQSAVLDARRSGKTAFFLWVGC